MSRRGRGGGLGIKSVRRFREPGALMFHDEFVDTDGVILSEHTRIKHNPLGMKWVKANTYDLEILNNKVTFAGNVDPGHKENDHTLELYTNKKRIECPVQNTDLGTVQHSITVRYIDNLNSVAVQWATIAGALMGIEIRQQIDSDSSGQIAGMAWGVGAEVDDVTGIEDGHTFRITDDGETITAGFINETDNSPMKDKIVSVDTTQHNAATNMALRTDNEGGQFWDYLKIWHG